MITFGAIKSLMEHAVGATPDSRHNLYETLNRAGRFCTDYALWSWRLAGPVALTVQADEKFVALPSDFGRVHTITSPSGGVDSVVETSLGEILQLHADAIHLLDGRWHINVPPFTVIDQGSGTALPRAMLYPTPTSTGSPQLELTYYRRWINVATDGTQDSLRPALPDDFEDALVNLCRGYCIDLQDQADSLEYTRAIRELERLKTTDFTTQTAHGPMRGGASDRRYRHQHQTRMGVINVD
jgi:hypothetical protein